MEPITEKQKEYLKVLIDKNVHDYGLHFPRGDEDYLVEKLYLLQIELPKTKEEASKWITALKNSAFGHEEVIGMDGEEYFYKFRDNLYKSFGSQNEFGKTARRLQKEIKSKYPVDTNRKFVEEILKMIKEAN